LVCVDASFVVKLVTLEPEYHVAQALWSGWLSGKVEIHAPVLLPIEAVSALRKQVKRGLMSEEAGDEAMTALLEHFKLIELAQPEVYLPKAWALAKRYSLTVVYDACYVALADEFNADLWTGDGRMLRAMPQHAGRIRTLNPGP
jgi:predicted nucleic acid-binding protein